MDRLTDPTASIEDVVTDQIMLDMLFQRLAEIMPEASYIGDLRMAGLSDAEIAGKIGVPHTTFLSSLKKAKEILQREYPDLLQILYLRPSHKTVGDIFSKAATVTPF